MSQTPTAIDVRAADHQTSVVDIRGDVTADSETALMEAYTKANQPSTRTIILNFGDLAYLNSGGIGMLVTLLVRTTRKKQQLLAYGLNQHYRQIFQLTRLDEAISIYGSEDEALAAAR